MSKHLKTYAIKRCRACHSEDLRPVFSLGNLAVSTFVDKPTDNYRKAPLELVACKECSLLQLKHNTPQELMYTQKYWYRSGINPKIVNDLKEIVERGLEFYKGGTWIDIGANDGTLLKFVPKSFVRVGIEPATNLQDELKKNCDVAVCKFWEEGPKKEREAEIITAIGMLYDSPNPGKFIRKVRSNLVKDGVFIAQLMTLRPMVENNDVSNICHEHLIYPNYRSLKVLFESNGLEIFRVEENDINGGSYRLFARHFQRGSIKYPEKKYGISHYKSFFRKIKFEREKTVSTIRGLGMNRRKVYGYAASTKGNTILQWYGLTNEDIVAIADKNPEKWGKCTVATNIPIVSEEEARKHADYFFILAWGFTKQFIERERKYGYRGKFITAIPNFEII